jgi:hypothetical protein
MNIDATHQSLSRRLTGRAVLRDLTRRLPALRIIGVGALGVMARKQIERTVVRYRRGAVGA